MTCIVALTNGVDIWMGGDAAGIGEDHKYDVHALPKVFRRYSESRETPWLFGFAGSFRVGQAIEDSLALPDPPSTRKRSIKAFIVRDVIKRLRECLEEHRVLTSKNGVKSMDGTSLIIGVAGHIILIESGFEVLCSAKSYDAIGNAADIAKGSLYTSELVKSKVDPHTRIKIALAAGSKHDASVQKPFTIISTKKK